MMRVWHLTALILLGACGSPLENPIDNIRACDQLYDELRSKGCSAADLAWLNCDVLPGCPSGQVEKGDIDSCTDKIKGAQDCAAALAVECEIAKVNCAGAAPVFQNAVGYQAACTELTTTVTASCPGDTSRATGICASVLECDEGGAFSQESITAAVDAAKAAGGCDAAVNALTSASIDKKYCYIPGN